MCRSCQITVIYCCRGEAAPLARMPAVLGFFGFVLRGLIVKWFWLLLNVNSAADWQPRPAAAAVSARWSWFSVHSGSCDPDWSKPAQYKASALSCFCVSITLSLLYHWHPQLPLHSFALIMAALWYRAGHYIFALWFLSFFYLSFFSSPNLSGHRVDVYHTSTHGVALVRI